MCFLIDVAILANFNASLKFFKKIYKIVKQKSQKVTHDDINNSIENIHSYLFCKKYKEIVLISTAHMIRFICITRV